MSDVFIFLLNKAITAGWVIIAVLLLRLLLRRAPRWVTCFLWGVVGLRLLLPVSLTSVVSLIPSATPIPENIALSQTPAVHTGVDSLNMVVNPIVYETFVPSLENSVNPLQVVLTVASWVWVAGVLAMILYAVATYVRLWRRVRVSVPLGDGMYTCDAISSPFILGVLKPRIFLPSYLAEDSYAWVIAHEKAHLRRGDHLIKPLGFILLSVYWFHPLVWVGYALLCRDIETACDEKVVRTLDADERCAYSTALVECSVHRRAITACPLAFGEVGVKARVKAVLNYKKPAFWLVLVAVVVSVAVAVCFLTDPKSNAAAGVSSQQSGADLQGVSLTITAAELSAPDPHLTVRWNNDTADEITYGTPFDIYCKQDGGWVNCRLQETVWSMPAYPVRAGGTGEITYRLYGLQMYIAGEYRLEASFSANGEEYTAWVEFTLDRGVEQVATLNFKPQKLWYTPPYVSYVLTVEQAPRWGLVNGTQLYEYGQDGLVALLGYMEQVTLDEENFLARMESLEGEEGAPAIFELYRNNKHAWQLYNGNLLYLLMEQQDGTYYMGYGTHNPALEKASFTWVFQLERVEETPNMSQPVVDGAIVFYRETVEEHSVAVYDAYTRLNVDELPRMMDALAEEQWVYDGMVDRTAFHFDGKLWYNQNWLYFGFEEKVVFYGEHFAYVSDETMAYFEHAQKNAEPFRGK